jgi:hypothetical protein
MQGSLLFKEERNLIHFIVVENCPTSPHPEDNDAFRSIIFN